MNIKIEVLELYLKKNEGGLNFFLIGNDYCQISYATDKILKKYFKDEAINIKKVNYRDLQENPSILQHQLCSLQLFSRKKALIIQNIKNDLESRILELIKNYGNKYLLILQAENFKKSSNTYKFFASLNTFYFINCYKLCNSAVINFIIYYLKKNNIFFNTEIVMTIANILPNNLLLIENELKKIIEYLGKDTELSIRIIHNILHRSRELEYIELFYSLLCGNHIDIVKNLYKVHNISVSNIIRIMQGYLNKIIVIKYIQKQKNQSAYNVINELEPPVFFREKDMILDICKKVSYKSSMDFMQKLIELEIQCKTSCSCTINFLLNYCLADKIGL